MVASEDAHATRAGVEILEAGGNAVDAAIAVAYALSVTHHGAGSLGGGGFMIVHRADGTSAAIDYREKAPAAATEAKNEEQLKKGAHGYLSAAVPGVVAGLELARERFGSLPREQLVAPALRLAEEGHPYGGRQATVLAWYWKKLKDPTLRAVLGRGDSPIGRGQLLRQKSLTTTLQAIAREGRAGFYEGEVAEKIAQAMKRRGGLVTTADLAAYRAQPREPLAFDYRGYRVLTMPPPSMGGVALFAITQHLAAQATTPSVQSADGVHFFIEASRRAYADRRAIGADPDFADARVIARRRARLFEPSYFTAYDPPIASTKATDSSAIKPLVVTADASPESPDTTHFSVVDRHGNAVSCTTTTSAAFGAWIMIPGTGVIMSNVMGAFSPRGVNALQPGKRPSSSMTPTIIVRQGRAVAAIGSPGGDTIPNTVAQVLRNLVDGHMTIDAAIEAPRVHHQYRPDQVRVEKKRMLSAAVIAELTRRGHQIQKSPVGLGDANGVTFDPDTGMAYGFADTRKGGLAAGPTKAPR